MKNRKSFLSMLVIMTAMALLVPSCKGKGKTVPKEVGSPVKSTFPVDNAVGVALDAQMSVEFNRPMDNTTITRLNFMLVDFEGKAVSAKISHDGKSATIAPDAPLEPDKRYKVILSSDVKDAAGSPMPSARTWFFTTESGIWSGVVQHGTSGDDHAAGVVIGDDRYLYVAGSITGSFEGNVNANAQGVTTDVFVAKLNTRGAKVWVKQIGVPEEDYATALAISRKNEVYVVGYTEGELDPAGSSQTGHDVFAAKFNSYGNKEWAHQTGPGHPISAAVGEDGSLYVVGYTAGKMEGQPAGFNDAFLMQYAPDGTKKWVRQFGTRGDDYAVGVLASGKDEVFVMGWSSHGEGPAGVILPVDSKGKKWGVWLALYDQDGTQKWVKQVEGDGLAVTGMASDASGNIYATGYSSKSRKGSGRDVFVLKCSKTGEKVWATRVGVGPQDMATSIAVSEEGEVLISGYTFGNMISGRKTNGSEDVFVMAFSPTGERRWTKQYGTDGIDVPMGMVYDKRVKGVAVVGNTTGSFEGQKSFDMNDIFLLRVDLSGQDPAPPPEKKP